mmetsp:Transcript_4906/g.7231  ORF Transcript_4906/g.7231 Transcript_4906/m.7231 type:complete len:281 (+) Transcript_4906:99-941(+)
MTSTADAISSVVPSEVLPIISNKKGQYQYYYDSSIETFGFVFIIAVGTGMSVTDYTTISTDVATTNPVVFVMLDPAPGNPVKLDGAKFANNANELVLNLSKYLPNVNLASNTTIVIGGHSAGGEGAIISFDGLLTFQPVGFLGLDPFSVNTKTMKIPCPAVLWGFSDTTCLVTVNQAAKAAYKISPPSARVFFQIKNPQNVLKPSSNITHCIFTDDGCASPVCPAQTAGYWVRQAVADSVVPFVESLVSGEILPKDEFSAAIPDNNQANLTLYYCQENPN